MDLHTDRRAGHEAGLWAVGVVAAGLAVLHSLAPGFPFPPVSMAQAVVRLVPGDLATFFIERLGHLALPLASAGTAAVFLGAGWVLGGAIPRIHRALRRRSASASVALALLPLWAAWVVLYRPMEGTAPRGVWAAATAAALVPGAVVGGLAYRRPSERRAVEAERRAVEAGADAAPDPTPSGDAPAGIPRAAIPAAAGRRGLLAALGLGAGALLVGGLDLGRLLRRTSDPGERPLVVPDLTGPSPTPPAGAGFDRISGLTPRVTSNEDFYVVDEAILDPVIDEAAWRLSLGGTVDRPVELTYEEVTSLPVIERYQTLECISNRVGGDLISTARWAGVRVSDVIALAGVGGGAVEAVFRSADGYSDSLELEQALAPETLLAIGMNGRVLPRAHGFPLRLLSLGTYGMKNPKWITEIEVVDRPYQGYWERRGWSKEALVKTGSRIDVPRDPLVAGEEATVAGIAFAGDRGISRVEVSTDGGETWEEAEVETPLSPVTWVRWQYRFVPAGPGKVVVTARASDGEGEPQTDLRAPPHPDGSSGWPSIPLEVRAG